MIRKLIPITLLFFVLAFSVSAASNITVTPSPITVSGVTGFTAYKNISLKNIGSTSVVNLASNSLTGPQTISAGNVTFNNTGFNLASGSSEGIAITVNIPAGTPTGTYSGPITTNTTAGSSNTTLTLTVAAQNPDFSLSSLDLGTRNPNSTFQRTITVTNNGNVPLTNVNISTDADSRYKIGFNVTQLGTLSVGESKEVKTNFTIPNDETSADKTLGNIILKSTEKTESFPITADIVGRMSITDLDITIDKDIDNKLVSHSNVEDGDTIKYKAKPTSEITFDVKIKNGFSEESDIDLEDIVITVTIDGVDDGDDLEGESVKFDIDADNEDRETVKLTIPQFVEQGTYDVKIEVEGDDSDGVTHKIKWEIKLKVDKKRHDVRIYQSSITPNTLKCSRNSNIRLVLANFGKDDEQDVRLEVINSKLGLNYVKSEIELDEAKKSDDTETFVVPVSVPRDLEAGTYNIRVTTYFDDSIIDDQQTLQLVVKDCGSTSTQTGDETKDEKQGEDNTSVVVNPLPPGYLNGGSETTLHPPTEMPVTTVEKPFTQSGLFIALVIISNLVIIGSVMGAVVYIVLHQQKPKGSAKGGKEEPPFETF